MCGFVQCLTIFPGFGDRRLLLFSSAWPSVPGPIFESPSATVSEYLAEIFLDDDGTPVRAPWDELEEYDVRDLAVYFQRSAVPAFTSAEEWASWAELKRAARGESPLIPAEAATKKLRALESFTVHEDEKVSRFGVR